MRPPLDVFPPSHAPAVGLITTCELRNLALRHVLEGAGFSAREITVERLTSGAVKVDAALIDLEGLSDSAIEQIAKNASLRACAIVLIPESRVSSAGRIARALRPNALLVWPIGPAQLIASVACALESTRVAPAETQPIPTLGRVGLADDVLARVLEALAAGGVIDRNVVAAVSSASHRNERLSLLTAREQEVVLEFVAERSVATVARRMHLSEHTVRNHLKRAYAKLGVHSRDELVRLVSGQRDGRSEFSDLPPYDHGVIA